ncbi:MAG: M24 family metallopeptidase, partial [Candidatus Hadarchaeia archaeon]
SDLIGDLRKTKTEKEIKRIKKSGQIAKRGMEKAREMSETGNTELEIAAEVEYEMRKIGSEEPAFTTVVAGGKNSRYPHFKASNKELKEGELLVVDLGAKWKNYNSDMTRTFGISPSREQRKLMEVTKRAKKEALKKLEGGTETSEIDKTVRKVFHKEGYEKYYLHSTGHGVGLSIHEPPRISPSSDETLKENMVVTVEPGLYTKKLGGCRFEDTFLVKKNGYENLTSPD